MAPKELELGPEYPQEWDEFIGQTKAVALLRLKAASAKARGTAADHVMLFGESGIGKTALAHLYAKEVGGVLYEMSPEVTIGEARKLFYKVETGDAILVDEAHMLLKGGKNKGDWLLTVLANGRLLTGAGVQSIPPVTFIMATTEEGRFPEPFMRRFVIPPIGVPTVEDAARIAQLKAARLMAGMPQPTMANCKQIAVAANLNPAEVTDMVKTLRDLVEMDAITRINGHGYPLEVLFDTIDLTHDGLDGKMREYLRVVYADSNSGGFDGGPVGENVLKTVLSFPAGLERVERLLVRKGYVARTGRGRQLTDAGMKRAKKLFED